METGEGDWRFAVSSGIVAAEIIAVLALLLVPELVLEGVATGIVVGVLIALVMFRSGHAERGQSRWNEWTDANPTKRLFVLGGLYGIGLEAVSGAVMVGLNVESETPSQYTGIFGLLGIGISAVVWTAILWATRWFDSTRGSPES